MEAVRKYFAISQRHTSPRTEAIAGLTTFLAMVYITIVNPSILADAGMDFGAVFVVTCLAAAIGSVLMGVLGGYPIALAPGMGQNAFFSYVIVLGMGYPWQTALGAVFISGIIFVFISILPIREWLINAIPVNLKYGISAGIGLFLGFIALKNAGLVVDNAATFVSLGDLSQAGPLIALAGFVLIVTLSSKKVTGAIIIGIAFAAVLGWVTGSAEFHGLVSAPPSVEPVLFQLDIMAALQFSMLPIILSLLLVDVFDTAGTLVGVANRAGLTDDNGKLPRLGPALLADSGATVVGAVLGTSSTTSYIESASGVESGGRTGLTSVTVGLLFLLCIFFAPLAKSIPSFATASALLFVACLMISSLTELDWQDQTEYIPAVTGALAMPLAFSIADGIGLAFITYCLIKILTGKFVRSDLASLFIALVFVGKFLLL